MSVYLNRIGEMMARDLDSKKIKGLYQAMINTFEQARMVDPRDPNLLVIDKLFLPNILFQT